MAAPAPQAAAPAPRQQDQHFSLSARPTCPSVLIPFENQLYALPVQKLDIAAEFNVSTAFVKITGIWRNIANYKVRLLRNVSHRAWDECFAVTCAQSDCLFVLPLNGTVTSVNIKINQRLFETVIIPKDEAEKIKRVRHCSRSNVDDAFAACCTRAGARQ